MKRQPDHLGADEDSLGTFEVNPDSLEEAERLAQEIIEYRDAPEESLDYLDTVNKYPPPLRIQIKINGAWHYLQDVHGNHFSSTHSRKDAMLGGKLNHLRERFPDIDFRAK
ncbi:MAG: hypothetical protein ABI865_14165 [Nitrosospira sp.]